MQAPPAITDVLVNDERLGFHLEDGRFISVPLAFHPTRALATAAERGRFEINGSSVYWPELAADIGVEGLLAGAREHHHYARQAVERAVHLGRLPKSALEKTSPPSLHPACPGPRRAAGGMIFICVTSVKIPARTVGVFQSEAC